MTANEIADELDGRLDHKAEQFYLDAFERGKQIGYVEGMISRKAQEK